MRKIAGKYQTKHSIYKVNGELVPDDEPVFLFRAQDKLLPEVLEFYCTLKRKHSSDPESLAGLDEQIAHIKKWQETNYTRLPR